MGLSKSGDGGVFVESQVTYDDTLKLLRIGPPFIFVYISAMKIPRSKIMRKQGEKRIGQAIESRRVKYTGGNCWRVDSCELAAAIPRRQSGVAVVSAGGKK